MPRDEALIDEIAHRMGRVEVADIDAAVERCGIQACMADAGDAWVYSTPVIHASKPAIAPARRRVLQVDYAARDLPGGLDWYGV
jgi:hypothetical protein